MNGCPLLTEDKTNALAAGLGMTHLRNSLSTVPVVEDSPDFGEVVRCHGPAKPCAGHHGTDREHMATKQEIIESINAGIQKVDATFSGLTDEQLQQTVHSDDGWTAKQILAHLAGRKGAYDAIVMMAETGSNPFAGGVNVDDWNQQAVDERIDKSRDELLAEFRQVHEGLIARVQQLDDSTLSKTVPMPRGELAVSDVLAGSGGRHSINHSAEVEQALGIGA